MGYYIDQNDGSIELPLRNVGFAIEALKKWMRDEQEYDDWNRFQKFEDIAFEFNLMATFDKDKNEYLIDNEGEKLWAQKEFLEVVAEFCNEGSYIEISGEDGCFWRWVIKDGQLLEINPSIDWNPNAIEVDSIQRAKEMILDIYHKNDLCLGEILASVSVVGLTVEEILELVEDLRYEIDGEDKTETTCEPMEYDEIFASRIGDE